jgi:putative toxin-antitoxin system antitoxin component (TIGR02293 family)
MSREKSISYGFNPNKKNIARGELIATILFPDEVSVVQESAVSYLFTPNLKQGSHKVFPKILDDDKNFHQLVQATRNGLSYKSLLYAQAFMPFSVQEWATMLHVSTRSIERLKKDKKKLTSSQSEKLIEITILYDYGVDVFGDYQKFSKWLERTNLALGGISPKSLLDTNSGINAVKTALSRIEYGVLA